MRHGIKIEKESCAGTLIEKLKFACIFLKLECSDTYSETRLRPGGESNRVLKL